jgi:photosystem II stability/assembly factor-like uncharacterized protein
MDDKNSITPDMVPAYIALNMDRPKNTRPSVSPSHKIRSIWFQSRTAWPYRDPPVQRLITERTRSHRRLAEAPVATQWESIGPVNVGGRMTCIVCHPQNPDLIWAGAAGGGVWTSPDAGKTWRPLWHKQPTLNIGSLAIDSQNPDILYCGTGEANLSADSYAGVGLFRSTNGGESWMPLAPVEATGLPTRIGAIAIDPADSTHIRVGGISYFNDGRSGMFVSRDGGVTWGRETFVTSQNYWCHAIMFHPSNPKIIFAAVTAQGSKSGLWRTSDGGESWHHLTRELPSPSLCGRISLAIALSNPDVMYAQIARAASTSILGVYRSADGGETWQAISGNHFLNERQMSYNNAIAVHPTNENHVICGGVDIHLTTNGGASWRKVTDWRKSPGDPDYAHADNHALLMPAATPGRVYTVNDGGIDVSEDGGQTWENRSRGLAVTMFYDVDVAQTNSKVFGGGCQDNGTQVTATGGPDDFRDLTGGDGGWIIFDPTNEGHIFASIYNLNIFRRLPNGQWDNISPLAPQEEKDSIWMCYLEVSPADSKTLFAGSQRVWRTIDDGRTWKAVSEPLDNSPITAIAIAGSDPQRVYIGTENGGFFRSEDGGTTWSGNLAGTLPGQTITRIDIRPDDPSVVVLCIGNFGHSHVFRSDDGGDNWLDLDQGNLPDVPHHALVIPPDAPATIYVGNDAGVFVSTDSGQHWSSLTKNLPNAMIVDLVYHEIDATLMVATYGRSLWQLKVR